MKLERSVTIGELARLAKCKIELIRYYDQIALLKPTGRTPGGNRLYNRDSVKRLFFIRRGRELGFSIKEIIELLKCNDHHSHKSCESVDQVAKGHLSNIQTKIDDLQRIQGKLKLLLGQCRRGVPSHCFILGALTE